jgi:hypothetical protein
MSATNLLGMPRTILLGGTIAVLVAATALTLKITQTNVTLHKVTLPRAALAAPAKPLGPAILSTHLQKMREEMALP